MKTLDYKKFSLLKTNRKATIGHISTIKKSMLKYGFLNSKPITVNSKFEIIDGQHRFLAAVDLNIPIVYEIDEVEVNDAMVTVNTTSNVWRLQEFITHYASLGKPDFIEIKDMINNTGYGCSNCISLYCGFNTKSKDIRNGNITSKNLKLNESIELIEFFKDSIKFYKTNKFIESIIMLLNRKDITKNHIDKLKINAFSIIECATLSQYTIQYNKILKIK